MRTFLLRAGLFAVLAAGLFAAFNRAIERRLRAVQTMPFASWNDLFGGQAGADLVILGNSHANVQLDPAVLRQQTGLRCYNLGLDGTSIDVQLVCYRLYRARYPKPKMVVQVLDYSNATRSEVLFSQFQYAPYLGEQGVQAALAPWGFPLIDRLPLIRHYGYFRWLDGYLTDSGQDTSGFYRGFTPVRLSWMPEAEQAIRNLPKQHFPSVDGDGLAAYRELFRRCRKDGVPVVVVAPPTYIEYTRTIRTRAAYWQAAADTCARYGVPLLNFSEDSLSYSKAHFYNAGHLNATGAALFSRKVGAALRTFLARQAGTDPGRQITR